MPKQPDKSAADILTGVGRALYEFEYEEPSAWPSRLAKALGVERNSLRNWLRGRAPFDASHGALDDLLALADRRADEVTAARDELRAWALDDLLALADRRADEVTAARDELRAWLLRNRP